MNLEQIVNVAKILFSGIGVSLQIFVLTFILSIPLGIIVAVLAGMIIGIRFMLGGAEEKANIKEILVPYVVGCVVVFGAFAIWKIVVTILSQI